MFSIEEIVWRTSQQVYLCPWARHWTGCFYLWVVKTGNSSSNNSVCTFAKQKLPANEDNRHRSIIMKQLHFGIKNAVYQLTNYSDSKTIVTSLSLLSQLTNKW